MHTQNKGKMSQQHYTLSQLCDLIEEALAECLEPTSWVQAEISSLSERGGHMSLELVESRKAASTSAKTDLAAKMRYYFFIKFVNG